MDIKKSLQGWKFMVSGTPDVWVGYGLAASLIPCPLQFLYIRGFQTFGFPLAGRRRRIS
jgi:hypothetical protein